MIGLLVAILLAAVVYFLCTAIGLPVIVAAVAAILVLLVGFPSTGGYGFRRGGARY